MRGRLRGVFDADNLLKVEKLKSEAESSEGDKNIVIDYGLPDGKEYPDYDEISPYFSINIHFGGKFDFGFNQYFGGKIAYFDMCSVKKLTLTEMEAMYSEVGCSTEKMDFWLLSNELEVWHENLIPIETERDLIMLIDLVQCNYKLARLYATSNNPTSDDEAWDFSFTQMTIDQRIERIEDIRVEIEGIAYDEATEDDEEEEKASFHGDSSNMDSSESDCPTPKKVRRVPPPNPPYRARRRGRFSMLRGLFKNTEDTLVILDDAADVVPTKKKNCDKKKNDGQISNHEASKKSKGETSNADKHPTTVEEYLMESVINEDDLQHEHDQNGQNNQSMHEDEDVINEEQEPDIKQQNESKDDGEDVNYGSASSEAVKTDQETNKRQRDAEDAAAFKEKLAKLQKSQTDMCAQKSAAKSPLKKTKTVNHGGVVKPFKAPAQAGPSGVEYFETNGQNVTTLKQLQSAIRKKKSNMKKKV
ncbi:hypothetical protein POM88_042303 [Heracleum sosnowskyi]|uniref:PB1-like domain-containing protein n=1 Tax=Heracleum sosnowskyi TaxID=360622 RepID=A0AAD8HFY8_9APIA|nr:hypothetical protein POM88_042303 [Heracleum sosnowskyi]